MLSISKPLNAATAEKYYDRDNYYLESPGQWRGNLADSLGLSGEIQENDFKNLLRGFDQNGKALIESAGKTYKDGTSKHQAGIDMTFSAPKSVSILSYQDDRIRKAFDDALNKTLDYAEANFMQTRHEKRIGEKKIAAFETTGSAAFAVFHHQCSRELDPQLHAHCVMLNLTQSENGEIRGMHNSKFYQNKMYLGQYFRNELALEIQKLGYQVNVTDRKKGLFEVKGVSKDIVEDFSKRREQVVEEVKRLRECKFKNETEHQLTVWAAERVKISKHSPEYGEHLRAEVEKLKKSEASVYAAWSDAELAALAATNSRIPKKNVTKEHIIDNVNKTLEGRGESLNNLVQNAQSQKAAKKGTDSAEELIKKSIFSLTKNESAFTKYNLINNASKLGLGDYSSEQLEEAFEELQKTGEIVFLENKSSYVGPTGIYTSAEIKRIEQESIDICKSSVTDICIDLDRTNTYIDNTNDQLHLNIALSKDDKKFEKSLTGVTDKNLIELLIKLRKQKQDSDKSKKIEPPNAQAVLAANPELREYIYKNGYGFTPGQKDALRQIVTTKNQFSVIQGDAGTGKSFSMMYAKQLLEAQGYNVRGLAPTGKAADELCNAAELEDSRTIHKLVLEASGPGGIKTAADKPIVKGKECFIIDEAGMVGSKFANKLIKLAKDLDAKVVFVGDRKQFAAVEAGRFFADLQDKAGVDMVTMRDVMRQKTDQTKDIVKAISSKDYNTAFLNLSGHKLADFDKTNMKNYKTGQIVTFSGSKNIPDGTTATISNLYKKSFHVRYENKDGKMVTISVKPKKEKSSFKVFEQEDKADPNSFTNCINVIEEDEARLKAVADDYLQCHADKKDALVITATNDDRKKLNTIIRETLTLQKHVQDVGEFTLRESKNTNEFADSFEEGTILKVNAAFKGFKGGKNGDELQVTEINTEDNTITVRNLKDYSVHKINPSDYMDGYFSTFSETNIVLGKNEKIAFLQNAELCDKKGKQVDVRNGQLATIIDIDKSGNVTARVGEGKSAKEVIFNLNENSGNAKKYNYITTAYALSSHKSQGMTVDKLIWHANTKKEISSNSFYVAITRCKNEVSVYTDNADKLRSKAQVEQEKYSTVGKGALIMDDEKIVEYNPNFYGSDDTDNDAASIFGSDTDVSPAAESFDPFLLEQSLQDQISKKEIELETEPEFDI